MARKKRETTAQMMERSIKEAFKSLPVQNHLVGCSFAGVHFDKEAVGAISTIAEGLVENAKALGNLALVLKATNVNVETLLKID